MNDVIIFEVSGLILGRMVIMEYVALDSYVAAAYVREENIKRQLSSPQYVIDRTDPMDVVVTDNTNPDYYLRLKIKRLPICTKEDVLAGINNMLN